MYLFVSVLCRGGGLSLGMVECVCVCVCVCVCLCVCEVGAAPLHSFQADRRSLSLLAAITDSRE